MQTTWLSVWRYVTVDTFVWTPFVNAAYNLYLTLWIRFSLNPIHSLVFTGSLSSPFPWCQWNMCSRIYYWFKRLQGNSADAFFTRFFQQSIPMLIGLTGTYNCRTLLASRLRMLLNVLWTMDSMAQPCHGRFLALSWLNPLKVKARYIFLIALICPSC